MNYVFDKCNVSEQCEKAFKDQISVLEAQSGIPSRVFDAVYKNNDISNSSALTRLYNQDNPDLYSNNQIAQFDSLCKEYLEGNNMQYDEALIHNTAVKAAQAYSDCFEEHGSYRRFYQHFQEQLFAFSFNRGSFSCFTYNITSCFV